ncbi:hypothetical protein OIU77_029520 [Salix suchowensis]|uniref:Uncharacterized protein n=1 Tax=Salix suchowensis TaxID=1278906 RepID=A0ABQ9BAS4_9ROSI|nr:hypothetical protein OIU77_029520 [Salix suchowensis]
MRGIRLRDLPSSIRTTDPDDFMFKYCVECAGRASEGSAVIFHTFDVLEQEVLSALYPMFPRVYTIGPLELLLNQKQEGDLSSVGCNLWKEEVECLHWLDSNKPRSVIYRCCIETISDGIPYSDIDDTQETDSNIAAAQNNMLALFIEVNAMGLQFAAEERSKVLVFFKNPVLN